MLVGLGLVGGHPLVMAFGQRPPQQEVQVATEAEAEAVEVPILVQPEAAKPRTTTTQEGILLHSPSTVFLTTKPTFLLKGTNPFVRPVFVNNQSVSVRNDGRFVLDMPLSAPGMNTIWVSAVVGENRLWHTVLRVYQLVPGLSIAAYPTANRDALIALLKLPLFHPGVTDLTTPITREMLAYAFYQLENVPDNRHRPDPKDAVRYVQKQGWMGNNTQGDFGEKQPATRLDMVIALWRKAPPDQQSLPKASGAWYQRLMVWAYKQGVISESAMKAPTDTITVADLVLALSKQPTFVALAKPLMILPTDSVASVNEAAFAYVAALAPSKKGSRIEAPAYTLSPTVSVTFRVPKGSQGTASLGAWVATFNAQLTTSVPLETGPNTLWLAAEGGVVTVNVVRLVPFEDMKGHWVESVAVLFRGVGIVPDQAHFEPKSLVLKRDLMAWMQALGQYTQTGPVPLQPLQEWEAVLPVARAEAVAAVVKWLGLPLPDAPKIRLPYRDVPRHHWSRPYLQAALNAGLIAPGPVFNPKTPITRAEFLALLSKTPPVKKMMDGVKE